jgi:hypothetical protein
MFENFQKVGFYYPGFLRIHRDDRIQQGKAMQGRLFFIFR